MVDNLAENLVLLAYNWDCKNCLLYRVAGCPLFRGSLSIEVSGRAVGTFRIVCYIVGVHCSGMSVNRGSTVLTTSHSFNMSSNIVTHSIFTHVTYHQEETA